MGVGASVSVVTPGPVTAEQQAYDEACRRCKQVADSMYHRLFAAAIAIMAIVIMVLVWFTGLIFQIVNFIVAFLIFALGVIIAILPIRCRPCECR